MGKGQMEKLFRIRFNKRKIWIWQEGLFDDHHHLHSFMRSIIVDIIRFYLPSNWIYSVCKETMKRSRIPFDWSATLHFDDSYVPVIMILFVIDIVKVFCSLLWAFAFQLYDFIPYRMSHDAESILFYRHNHESSRVESLFKG